MNRFFLRIRGIFAQLRDGIRTRLLGRLHHERVVTSEPRSTARSTSGRKTVPASIDSAHFSDVHQIPEGEAVARQERHELSSLRGSHAIAPSSEAAGQELVDTGALEVPIGQTADRAYHDELDHGKLPQPESTGASLQFQLEHVGAMLEDTELENLTAGEQPHGELTAIPKRESERELFPFEDEHYDSIDAEDLGATFLSRATEDRNLGRRDEWDEDVGEQEIDREALEGDVVPQMMSEASRSSASNGEDEISELEELHLEEGLRDTVPMDVQNRRSRTRIARGRPSQV